MKIRYNGPYEAVEVAVPGIQKTVRRGEEIECDVEVAEGLCHGGFEKVGYSAPVTVAPSASDDEE